MTPQNRIEQYLAAIKAAWTGETPLPEYPPEPAWRIESFLAAILSAVKGDSPVLSCPDPVWDIEAFGRAIYDALTGASPAWPCPVPTNNTEMILYAIYKAVSDGGEEATPLPAWNIERWLLDVYEAAKEGGDTKATVAGVAPITLSDAISAAIISLKQYGLVTQPPKVYYDSLTQYGLCVQNGTPAPDASVDILCNNGPLRYGALGRNLLDPSAANTVLEYYINKADGEVKPSPPNFMFAGYMPVEAGKTYVAYGRAKTGNDLSDYNRVAWYDSSKNWISGADYTQNRIAVVTAPANAAYARFSCNPTGTTTTTVTQALVDSYNWTFCEGNAEVVPFVPFVGGIYTDGTPEVLTVSMKNLYDASTRRDGKSIDSQGAYVNNDTGGSYSPTIPIEVGKRYRFSGVSGSNGSTRKRIIAYSTIEVYTYYMSGNPVEVTDPGLGEPYTAVIDLSDPMYANAKYIRLSFDTADTDVQLTEDVATQTASVPMLLSVGDVADEAEIISGIKTGKVCAHVFDGTESEWTFDATYDRAIFRPLPNFRSTTTRNIEMLCSHFVCKHNSEQISDLTVGDFYNATQNGLVFHVAQTSLEDWKAHLAAQYAAGTPVIVIYPLATETTEQTTAQHLTMSSNSEVSIVANVSGIVTEIGHSEHTTPSPEYPLPLFCNNGELVVENGQVVAKGEDEKLYIKPGLDIELLPDAFEQGGINVTTGGNESSNGRIRLSGYIDVEGDKSYVISSLWTDSVSTDDIYLPTVYFYDEASEYISSKSYGGAHPRGANFVTPANCAKVRFVFTRTNIDISTFVSARFFKHKESVSPVGANLFNRASGDFAKYLDGSGKPTDGEASHVSDYIRVYGQAVYRFSGISGQHNVSNKPNNKRVVFYNASKTKIGDVIVEAVNNANTPYAITFTTPSGAVYVRLSLNTADYDVMLKIGSEEIEYEPYIDTSWQTAFVPMLLSMGDTKDEVELIAGTYPHRCAACVYDGTQDVGDTYLSTTGGKDIGAIIVYPLATPDTEQITPQALSANEGMNIVEARSNVSPVELEATYKKSRH